MNSLTLKNLIYHGDTSYRRDLRDRLVGLDRNADGDTSDTNDVTWKYDYQGNRVRESVVGGATTYYLTDANNPTGYSQVLEEQSTSGGGSPDLSYLIGLDMIGQDDGGTISYLLPDGIGSTRVLLDGSGNIAATYDFRAFGELWDYTGTATTAIRFAGEQYDSQLGEYYLRARYYNPITGRFQSMDSYAGETKDPTSLNKYVYANANPVYFTDPSGHGEFTFASLATAFSIGGLLNAGVSFAFGERSPRKLVINGLIGGISAIATGGAANLIGSRVSNILLRSGLVALSAGGLGFAQNILSQYFTNNPGEPIDLQRAKAAALMAGFLAGVFTGYAGDRYDSGTITEENAKKLYDLATGVASEFAGTTADQIYSFFKELKKQGVI